MDDSHFFEIFQSLVNIRDNLSEVLIVERFLVDDAIFEIAFVAQFGDDVAVAFGEQSLVEFENVGMIDLLEYFDLLKDEIFEQFGFERIQ